MTFSDYLLQSGYTVYRLAKESGVALTTVTDIESGRSNLMDCRGRILLRIAKVLNVPIEFLLSLEQSVYNKAYEENIPDFLKEGLSRLRGNRKKNDPLRDCYLDEVNSSINVCEVENLISKEQADYLRNKYL